MFSLQRSLLTIAALFLGLATFATSECQTAYIISRRKNLVKMNVTTGETEKVAELDPAIRPVGGLGVDTYFDITYIIGNVNTNNSTLIKINRLTGEVIDIVGHVGFRAKGLAVDCISGYVFTMDRNGNKIYAVDPYNNAEATLLVDSSSSSDPLELEAIGFDYYANTLYGSKDAILFALDFYNSPYEMTKLGRVKNTLGLEIMSMFFHPDLDNGFYALGSANCRVTREAPIFEIGLDDMEAVYQGVSGVNNPFGGDLYCDH